MVRAADPTLGFKIHNWLVSTARPFPAEHRQITIGHLQRDQGHGAVALVAVIAGPVVSVDLLPLQKHVAESGVIGFPIIAAGQEHGLRGVVIAVIKMAFHVVAEAAAGDPLLEIIEAAFEVVGFKDAGVIEAGAAGRGPGESTAAAAAVALVAESSVVVLAGEDVRDRLVAD